MKKISIFGTFGVNLSGEVTKLRGEPTTSRKIAVAKHYFYAARGGEK